MVPNEPAIGVAGLVDAERLVAVLEAAGWRSVGGREGAYTRLVPPGEESERYWNVVVPLDPTAPDYQGQLEAALGAVSRTPDTDWRRIGAALSQSSSDQFCFQKETGAPSGFIRWGDGERMLSQAKSILVAGAKAHVDKAPYFANRLGQYAKRFLDTVLMGQTFAGSYVVTAFVPSGELVPLHSAKSEGLAIEGVAARTGEVTESILRAIEAVAEALQHHRDDFPERTITLVGQVHLMRRDQGGPPVIGIDWVSPAGRRKMRARLAEGEDYEAAVQAHLEGSAIQVTGVLVRIGRQYSLDRARLEAVLETDAGTGDDLPDEFLF